mgnify:FL=1|jgi:cob(I)alamin adenosyltransferase|tara:strand:- start:4781 stop:5017 length:237 start_codon:yes stop_codon:yes gene_type:complete
MQSPYEERAGELLEQKKKELFILKKQILTENGFFGKRRLEKKIKETTEDVEYLRNDIYRYKRALAWNRQTPLKKIRKV